MYQNAGSGIVFQDLTAKGNITDGQGPRPRHVRWQTETHVCSIRDALLQKCCVGNCVTDLGFDIIRACRDEFWSSSRAKQRSFISRALKGAFWEDNTEYVIFEGRKICLPAWKTLYGVKDRRFRTIRSRTRTGLPATLMDGRLGQTYNSHNYTTAKIWLEGYVRTFSERLPCSDELHLPSCLNQSQVFKEYQLAMNETKTKAVSFSTFRRMWERDCPTVKIAKDRGIARCNECVAFQTLLLKKLSKESRTEVEQGRRQHLTLQRLCREKYYRHIHKSRAEPTKYCSIIIDGMDQAKTSLPHFRDSAKVDSSLNQMHHHVTGVKSHGVNQNFIFTSTDALHPDANLTLHCLVQTLDKLSQRLDGRMPEVLYLQADNSGKDNKNNYVLSFLGSLVRKQVFKKIKLNFLMVGHTHEDIDQIFSRISVSLRKTEAKTLPQLHGVIRTATSPHPEVHHVPFVYDYKSCLQFGVKLQGVSQPHCFRFTLEGDRVMLGYKNWPIKDEPYRSLDITSMTCDWETPLPVTHLNPKLEVSAGKMRADIRKYVVYGRLNKDEETWWQHYLEGLSIQPPTTLDVTRASNLCSYKDQGLAVAEESEPDSALMAVRNHTTRLQAVTQMKIVRQRVR